MMWRLRHEVSKQTLRLSEVQLKSSGKGGGGGNSFQLDFTICDYSTVISSLI